jgi:hypothetical protein
MIRVSVVVSIAVMVGFALAAPAPKDPGRTFLDLQPYGTHKLVEDSASGLAGNNLASLPTGDREFAGVKFQVGEKYLQLGSPHFRSERPEKIEGIKVGRAFRKLYILQSTGYGSSPEGSARHISDGTLVAEYRIKYEGGDTATIEVVYGKHVRDYWFDKDAPGVTSGKVAWEGDSDAAKRAGKQVRLFLTTWENPKPGRRVVEIDYVRAKETPAAPFCVALTAE